MSRLPRSFDPQALQQEYITSDISIRKLAERHSISWSTLANWARKEDWAGQRSAYKSALAKRGYEVMAATVASQQGVVNEESVAVLRATVRVYAQALARGEIKLTPRDMVEVIRELRALTGDAEASKEAEVVTVGPAADEQFYRRMVDSARRRLAGSGLAEGDSAPRAEKPRPN